MKFYKPETLTDLFSYLAEEAGKMYFLAGGTDINVQLKKGMLSDGHIIFINHLEELKGIEEHKDHIFLGALTTYEELLDSKLIRIYFPYLQESLDNFASPLIANMATIGGNIANGSPTNDITPPLLVRDAEIELISSSGSRGIPLSEFFTGYKEFAMQENEIIKGIIIPKYAEKEYVEFYQKVGARKTLTIAKVSLSGMKKVEHHQIIEIKLAAGSLNVYPRRLPKLEAYLTGKTIESINYTELDRILQQEITPISDLRSDKEYRYQTCFNLIKTFINK